MGIYNESYDASSTMQRSVSTMLTQDDTNLSYVKNPRQLELTISDPSGNHKRTSIEYQTIAGTNFTLPVDTKEYDANTTTLIRRTHIDYVTDSAYLNQRLIGLPAATILYDANDVVKAKTTYLYDEPGTGGDQMVAQGAPVQHDETYYSISSTLKRGNLTTVEKWDANSPTTEGSALKSRWGTTRQVCRSLPATRWDTKPPFHIPIRS